MRLAAAKAPVIAWRSRRRRSVTALRWPPAESPPIVATVREPERLEALAQQPQRRVLAVVGRRRIGVLGRQAVVDAHRAQAGGVGELDEQRVLEVAPRSAPTRRRGYAGRRPRRSARARPPAARSGPSGPRSSGPARGRAGTGGAGKMPPPSSRWRRACSTGISLVAGLAASWRSSSALNARVSASTSSATAVMARSYDSGMPTRSRSTRPRGASTWRTATRTGSPSRMTPPVRVPSSIVPCSLSSHQSPRRRRTGSIPW